MFSFYLYGKCENSSGFLTFLMNGNEWFHEFTALISWMYVEWNFTFCESSLKVKDTKVHEISRKLD